MSIIHSVPEFLLEGKKVRLSFAVQSSVKSLTVTAGDKAVKAKKTGVLGELTVYTAALKAEVAAGNDFSYSVDADGETAEYSVKVAADCGLPPLAITEIYGRPKDGQKNVFFEIVNPTSKPVDLYDYKLMQTSDNDMDGTDIITDEKGKYIMAPGEVAVLHFLSEGFLNTEPDKTASFAELCNATNKRSGYEVDESVRVIPVEVCDIDEKTGKAKKRTECFMPQSSVNRKTDVYIVPREGDICDAVFAVAMNRAEFDCDNPVKRSSLWTVAYPDTKTAKNLKHAYELSPGRLEGFQRLPDLKDEFVPLTVDLTSGTVYTADGLTFSVAAGEDVKAVAFEIKQKDGTFRAFDAVRTEEGFAFTLDAEKLAAYSSMTYRVRAEAGLYSSESEEKEVVLYDNLGPSIDYFFPCECFWFENRGNHRVYAEFSDPSGIDVGRTEFYFDGKNYTEKCKISGRRLLFNPKEYFTEGQHTAELIVYDICGNSSSLCRVFSVAPADMEFKLYRGEVHCHTGDSDGSLTPADAMEYARDTAKVDFFAVTDHSHYETAEVYKKQMKIADSFNVPGEFAALYGFEMTWNYECDWWGHMNVLNTSWIDGGIYRTGLPELLDKVAADPRAIAMFNHPGVSWGNFRNYSFYTPGADRRVCLSEIRGRGYDYDYMLMLSEGWHASPAYNEDNHAPNWANATENTTYIAAPALTRDNVLEAMRNRRTYSSCDPTLKITFKVNGKWFGSRLYDPHKLHFDISLSTEKDRGLGLLEVVTEDNIVVASKDAGCLKNISWKFDASPDFDYYYLRVTSDGKYSVTAPVWVISDRGAVIKSLTSVPTDDPYLTDRASIVIKSANGKALRDVRADIYLTKTDGFRLDTAEPFRSLKLGDLAAGKMLSVGCPVPYIPERRRLTVIVSSADGLCRRYDTSFALLFPVTVTEVMNLTSDKDGVKNPFPYVKLRNRTAKELSLDGMVLRLWAQTGKAPVEERTLKLDGAKIAPKGELVIWIRKADSKFTSEDFNARYGTALTEGEDLLITDKRIVSSQLNKGRQLELVFRGEAIDRACWNYGAVGEHEIVTDKAIVYNHVPNKSNY